MEEEGRTKSRGKSKEQRKAKKGGKTNREQREAKSNKATWKAWSRREGLKAEGKPKSRGKA